MRQLRKYARIPNTLIDDTVMHYTSKRLYLTMALAQRKTGVVKMTVAELGRASGLCEETVLQALAELEAGGFLRKMRNWRWSQSLCCPVYAANTYWLRGDLAKGYTLVSGALLGLPLTAAQFCVLLFLYRCAGRQGRAFPSIRCIAGLLKNRKWGLQMAKSTVLRALKQLERLSAFVKLRCDSAAGDASCNSYCMTAMVLRHVPRVSLPLGGRFIFREAPSNNKIT